MEGLSNRIEQADRRIDSNRRNNRIFRLDLINEELNIIGELTHILDKIAKSDFEGVHAQRIWLNFELAFAHFNLAFARRARSQDYQEHVSQVIFRTEWVLDYHNKVRDLYNKNNAQWLRDEYIIENAILIQELTKSEFNGEGNFNSVLFQLPCEFFAYEYYLLVDDPLFIKHGGTKYVQENCNLD